MKEQLKKVSSLIEKIDDVKNKDDYSLLENKIKEELLGILLDTSKGIFVTAINLKVLKPIQDKIKVAIHFIETKRSRSFRSERLKILSRKDFLINLRNQILIDYREQLKGLELYKEFLIEKANNRFLILNPTQDYPIEVFTHNQFENILKKSFVEIINYFNEQQLTNSNYKEEMFLFVGKVNRELKEITKRIDQLRKFIEKNQSKDMDIFDLYQEIDLLNLQESYLLRIIKELESTHLFLKIHTPKKENPLTVFGDRDLNKLERLYFELEDFLEKSIQLEDITSIFTLNYEPTQKVNLRNGTINDFAYLINQMYPYFISDIAHRNKYNQWWADRFTINGVDKNKDAIVKMRSNTKKDVTRKQQNTARLNSIIDVLR
ncbi:hypothetical protein [uncultured Polaribacter sp.]|uniref:hypothetical protein n=1 Tax=uncultured Polaribacter sp. TaxID=174711 RepID=UPI002634B10C|nr:hypothetical protein [uncultured Polaribacter sp.]